MYKISANQTVEILKRAIIAVGGNLSANHVERKTSLIRILTDEVGKILDACDADFYKYNDNLEELNYQFILENKAQFSQ